jgi:hypothetical protein
MAWLWGTKNACARSPVSKDRERTRLREQPVRDRRGARRFSRAARELLQEQRAEDRVFGGRGALDDGALPLRDGRLAVRAHGKKSTDRHDHRERERARHEAPAHGPRPIVERIDRPEVRVLDRRQRADETAPPPGRQGALLAGPQEAPRPAALGPERRRLRHTLVKAALLAVFVAPAPQPLPALGERLVRELDPRLPLAHR